jgi:hypothetical protein
MMDSEQFGAGVIVWGSLVFIVAAISGAIYLAVKLFRVVFG